MPFPTSRKKYYLSIEIKPEWTDSELITELKDHVESRSSESVRDIFLRHSERIGCFSVKSRDIADRLVATFDTVNVSCRGRKPISEIAEISSSKFQLRLSNLNNVMSSNQFEQWVLSLREYTFDIHLFSTKIMKGCKECILSFDSIDAAIAVKKNLQNSVFRGESLYFTHWHVPRRYKDKARSSQSDSSCLSQSSGYSSTVSSQSSANSSASASDFGSSSSCTSSSGGSSSSSSSGPLYLSDSSVPAPPRRAPPSPPSKTMTRGKTMSRNNNHQYNNKKHHNGKYVASLHSQLKQQQQIISELVQQNALMINRINQQNEMNKVMNEKFEALQKKYDSVNRRNSVLLWSVGDIVEWLTTLENGKYDKYKYHLLFNMTEEKVTGSMLSTLNVTDWHRLGVSDVKDQHDLLRHVYSLIYV